MPTMADLARIGVAIDEDLLAKFDKHIGRKGYGNRSEAFRDLIRDDLINEEVADPAKQVVGSLTLVYDHHVRLLSEKLTELQHEHHESIVSTVHVHLTHHDCLEVLVLRGKSGELRQIADRLLATKGVKHGKLVVTAAS